MKMPPLTASPISKTLKDGEMGNEEETEAEEIGEGKVAENRRL